LYHTPFEPLAIAGVVDQDAAHGLGSGGEEMSPAVEPLVTDQAEVRFVDQRRGLRLPGTLRCQARGGELAQLVVDERK
jgi:hypothetical protein